MSLPIEHHIQPLRITNTKYHAELHLPSPVLCLPVDSTSYTNLTFRLTRTATGRPLTWTDLALASERRLHVVIVRSNDLTAMGHVHIIGEDSKHSIGEATANAAKGLYLTRWKFPKPPGTYSIMINFSPVETMKSHEKFSHNTHHHESVSATFSILAKYWTAGKGTLENERPIWHEISDRNVLPITDTYRYHGIPETTDGESIDKLPERDQAVYETQLTILESSSKGEKEKPRLQSLSDLSIETCYLFLLNYSRSDSSSLHNFIPSTHLQPYLGHAAHVTVARKVTQLGIDDWMMHLHAVPVRFDGWDDMTGTCEKILKEQEQEPSNNQTFFGPIVGFTVKFNRPGIYRLFAQNRHATTDGRVEMLEPAFTMKVDVENEIDRIRRMPYIVIASIVAGILFAAVVVVAYLRRRKGTRYKKLAT